MSSPQSAIVFAVIVIHCSTCPIASGQYVVQALDPCGPGLPHHIMALDLMDDGSCLVASQSDSSGWVTEVAVFKLDSAHDVVWARRSTDLPGVNAIADCGQGASCILADRKLIKLDPTGEVVWALNISGGGWYLPSPELIVDSNGDIVVVFNEDGNMFVSRVRSNGELRWSKRIAGNFIYIATPYCALGLSGSDSTGHTIFIGYVDTSKAPPPYYSMALRMDPDGSVPWSCTYSVQGENHLRPYAIEAIGEDLVVLAGRAWDSNFYMSINANDGFPNGMRHFRYSEGEYGTVKNIKRLPGVGFVSVDHHSPVSSYANTIALHDMEGNVVSSGALYNWSNAWWSRCFPLGLTESGALAFAARGSSNDELIFANILDSPGAWLCGADYEPVFDSTSVVVRQGFVPDVLPGIVPTTTTAVLVPTTVATTYLCQGASISEPKYHDGEVVISPHPVEGLFNIRIGGGLTAPIVVGVCNALGQSEVISREFMHEGALEMDGQSLLPGVHILRIRSEDRTWIGRFVKK